MIHSTNNSSGNISAGYASAVRVVCNAYNPLERIAIIGSVVTNPTNNTACGIACGCCYVSSVGASGYAAVILLFSDDASNAVTCACDGSSIGASGNKGGG